MKIEEKSSRKYQQIRDALAAAIRAGQYPPKKKLPSEAQLARKYSASRGTVLRALLDLIHAGLIERRRGSGTYVKTPVVRSGEKFALIAPALSDSPEVWQGSVMAGLLRRIAEESGSRGYSLIHNALPSPTADKDRLWCAVEDTVEHRPSGAFFMPLPVESPEIMAVNREIARTLSKAQIPIVLLDCDLMDRPDRSAFDLVCADNHWGGAALAEHMLEYGCHRIGFVTRIQATSTVSERILGYQAALLKHGITPNPKWVFFQPDLQRIDFERIITQFDLDGLIFKDDNLAALGCKILSSLGYRIGRDIKVAGFDDAAIATLLPVPLTTVRQPINDMAVNAISLLLDRVQNPNQPARTMMVNCELIVRESTANIKKN